MIEVRWSSRVARKAHNLEDVGSNPTRTTLKRKTFCCAPGIQGKQFWLGGRAF